MDHLDSAEIEKVKEGKRRGEALEVIVGDQVELNDWFGPNALLTRTSEYDDVMNGIDAVAEFDFGEERKPERLALGVDASMRADVAMIERKITRNIEKVTGQREPAEVRYFESQILDAAGHPSVKGRLEAVVPVVIGLDGEDCDRLMCLFVQLLRLRSNKEKTESINALIKEKTLEMQKHPVQMVFLLEIKTQLEMYLGLFKEKVMDGDHLAYQSKVKRLLAITNEIIDSKTEISTEELGEDGVWQAITEVAGIKLAG